VQTLKYSIIIENFSVRSGFKTPAEVLKPLPDRFTPYRDKVIPPEYITSF
jgi:hypothetical protein